MVEKKMVLLTQEMFMKLMMAAMVTRGKENVTIIKEIILVVVKKVWVQLMMVVVVRAVLRAGRAR
jgi:hypothetical protein